MLNFEFVGNIETLHSVRYIAANHVGAGIALLLPRWNSYRQQQGTFDNVQMLGERRGLDAMANARKNLLVGQVFDAISDGKNSFGWVTVCLIVGLASTVPSCGTMVVN